MNYSKSILLVAFVALTSMASAQLNSPLFSGFKLNSVNTNFGPHGDHFSKMNLDFMESRVNDNSYQRADIADMQQVGYVSNTTGANLNLSAQFVRVAEAAPVSRYEAIETTLGLHFGREVMIDYYQNDPAVYCGFGNLESCYSNLTYCDLSNEINVSAAYKRGVSFFNTLNIYTGLGAGVGTTMASQLMIFGNRYIANNSDEEVYEYVDERYSLNESVTGRVYIPIGGELVVMKKLRLTAETRLGVGYSHAIGSGGFSNLNYSALVGFGWTL